MRQTFRACLAWLALAIGAAGPASAAPSTFGNVIGNAILCRSHLDNHYFQAYLAEAFGPPYKREGGAYWYKADGTLWGAQVTDVIVSDDTSPLTFVGAVAETTPDLLGEAVRAAAGLRHVKVDNTQFSALAANLGSKIVFFNTRSKIYCAKFKQLPPHLQGRS
jgi:hypothetical protein